MLAKKVSVLPFEMPKTNIKDKFNKLIEIARSEGIRVVDLDFEGEITGFLSKINNKSILVMDRNRRDYYRASKALMCFIEIHLGKIHVEPQIINGNPMWIY